MDKRSKSKRRKSMSSILIYSFFHVICKHVYNYLFKLFSGFSWQIIAELSFKGQVFTCLHLTRKKVKKVLRGDFFGVRGCCRTCLRENMVPGLAGFSKWRDRLRWVCLCFECKCKRCTRHVYGKCMA